VACKGAVVWARCHLQNEMPQHDFACSRLKLFGPPSVASHGSASCAEEYQPPGFKSLDEEEAGFFARRPFAMDIGTVATQYHGVRLRVTSLLLALKLPRPTAEH